MTDNATHRSMEWVTRIPAKNDKNHMCVGGISGY